MASKLAAAKLAAWSGVRTVIASASRPGVLGDAIAGTPGVGTVVQPHDRRLPARKLWIAFAVGSGGMIIVDEGAQRALVGGSASLLAAGIREVKGSFDAMEAVEVAGPDGRVFAKGLVRVDAATVEAMAGKRSVDLAEGTPGWVIHRDELVVLPA